MSRRLYESPRIYVADLAAYNAGSLHGAWIDADQDPDEIHAEIEAMLAKSPVAGSEEAAIHDYDGWGPLRLSEHEDIETISRAAKLIAEHGPLFAAVVEHLGGLQYLDEAEQALEENYAGSYRSAADWAEEFAEETGASMDQYRPYVAWDDVARDAEMNGDVWTVETGDGQVHVFYQ